jgi:hypothetical protein
VRDTQVRRSIKGGFKQRTVSFICRSCHGQQKAKSMYVTQGAYDLLGVDEWRERKTGTTIWWFSQHPVGVIPSAGLRLLR